MAAGVTNARSYLTGTRVGRLDNLEFALLVNAHPDDHFSAEAQVYGAPPGQRTRLDWGFATWRFSRSVSMRVGQVKYPAGLSGEVRDVGVKRPFLALPSSIYGAGAIIPESFRGAAVTGEVETNAWTLAYDAYGGNLQTSRPESTAGAESPFTAAEDRVGGGLRVEVRTPLKALKFSVSGAYAPPRASSVAHAVVGISAEYADDRWLARSEYFHRQLITAMVEDATYLEVARFLFPHVQVAGLVDFSRTRLLASPAPGSPSAMHHLDLALGLNAWVTRDLVVKMAIHEVSGGRFVTAPTWSDTARTTLYELGAQFAF